MYENVLNDNVFPETTNWEDFLIDFYDFVVDFDGFGILQPLNHYVESPSQIRSKFSLETYRKGALILRMLKDAITEEVFIQGVKYYLDEMQFKSASPDDLFAGIQKAYDEAFPGTDINISELMQTWTNLPGIPIVTVSRSDNGLLLTQEGLGTSNDDLFSIPINFATASNKNFDDVKAEFWMTTKEHEITRENTGKTWTDDDWIIFNLRETGYYMTNYDETLWGLITSSLANDHEGIHFFNRGTLFADSFRFIEHAVDFRATIYLELIDSLKLEFHPHVWRRANQGMRVFESRLRGSELHGMFLAFMNDMMSGIYGRSFENDFFATNIVNRHSCSSGVQACNDDALQALIEVMETGRTDFAWNFRCNAFRVANETVWMHFFDDTMSRRGETWERMFFFFDLECTQNPKLIQHVLESTIDMTNNLLPFERDNMMRFMPRESFVGYEAVIEFVKKNHEIINKK